LLLLRARALALTHASQRTCSHVPSERRFIDSLSTSRSRSTSRSATCPDASITHPYTFTFTYHCLELYIRITPRKLHTALHVSHRTRVLHAAKGAKLRTGAVTISTVFPCPPRSLIRKRYMLPQPQACLNHGQ